MKLSPEAKLAERCHVLADSILAVRPIYQSSSTTPNQRQLLETMIGAALWYMPQLKHHWTGKISASALESFLPEAKDLKPRLTQDHCYPRKLAAAHLLNDNWFSVESPGVELQRLYDRQFGRFNYISPIENRKLMPFQRQGTFSDMDRAYADAKIDLLEITAHQLKHVKARNRDTILELLRR